MKIPSSFKTKIEETFYDKLFNIYNKEQTVDDEGWAKDKSTTKKSSVYGNVRFNNLAELQEEYGIEEEIDIAITTSSSVELGDILEYEGNEYRVIGSIPYDSHNLIFAKKWLSQSSTLTSV